MANLFNQQAFEAMLSRELGEGMLAAAEPIVRKALEEAEREMRAKLAAMLVGFIQTHYSIERNRNEIVVRVALGKTVGEENDRS